MCGLVAGKLCEISKNALWNFSKIMPNNVLLKFKCEEVRVWLVNLWLWTVECMMMVGSVHRFHINNYASRSPVSQHRKFYFIFTVFYHYIFHYRFLIQLVRKGPLSIIRQFGNDEISKINFTVVTLHITVCFFFLLCRFKTNKKHYS